MSHGQAQREQQLVRFVNERLVWSVLPRAVLGGQSPRVGIGLGRVNGEPIWFTDTDALGNALAADLGFQVLRLGTWLSAPDGELIASAVGQVLPPQYRPEYRLVVEGLQLAAAKQRSEGWARAIGLAAGALIFVAIWGSPRGGRA